MKLAKHNQPFGHPSLINWIFDDVFIKDAFNNGGTNQRISSHMNRPKTNVIKNDHDYTLELAVPGFKKEDFSLEIKEGQLSVSAKNNSEVKKELHYKSREFDYSEFKRSYKLPKNTDEEKITALFENGVLYITLPLEEEKIKTIDIKVK